MHRWRSFLCVFLIFFAPVFFGGCSSQTSGAASGNASSSTSGKVSAAASGSASAAATANTSAAASESENHTAEQRTTLQECLVPEASGTTVYEDDTVSIDASNISEGYVMVRYQGDLELARLQFTVPDGSVYSYILSPGDYETFPLSGGDGAYHLEIYEPARDGLYALIFSQDIEAQIRDEFLPFLYPNQYVWYAPGDKAVAYGAKLSGNSSNDLDYVEQVYHYVTENITYDEELAATVTAGYLPDSTRTMETGKGICFDYASLMAVLLRCQGVPTRLVVGYSGEAYHAWISVYLKEIGWVDSIIEFDGKSWSLMDPTLAANNNKESVKMYIGDGDNYTEKFFY
ncbi:MAG TPA: transglutaminase [Lachnospiraceae bacterium]|nr:transglutaminase [Lachnospiraceae bacterium]